MVSKKKPFDKRSKKNLKGKLKLLLQLRVMEGPRRKDANVHLLLKCYYFLIIVIEKCYYKGKKINAIGGLCHGNIF
jgi:hypothetical protein